MYYVHRNLNHDGTEYRVGDEINISGDAADQLEVMGVIGRNKPEGLPAPTKVEEQIEEEAPAEAKVGGAPSETGEPSIDTKIETTEEDTAKDITPGAEGEQTDISENL